MCKLFPPVSSIPLPILVSQAHPTAGITASRLMT